MRWLLSACACARRDDKNRLFDVKMRSGSACEIAGRRMTSCAAAAAPSHITAAGIRIWSCMRKQMTERLETESNLRESTKRNSDPSTCNPFSPRDRPAAASCPLTPAEKNKQRVFVFP